MRQQRRGESTLEAIGGIVVAVVVIAVVVHFVRKDRNEPAAAQSGPQAGAPGGQTQVAVGNLLQDKSGFRGDNYAATIRNSGAAGPVSVRVTFKPKRPAEPGRPKSAQLVPTPRTEYFAVGEERTLLFPLPEWARDPDADVTASVELNPPY